MEVEVLKDENKYEEYVKDKSFFHSLKYRDSIVNTFNFEPIYLVAKTRSSIKGVLPLFICNNKLISLPFSTEGGIIAENDDAREHLISEALRIVKERKLDYFELREKEDYVSGLEDKDYYYHLVMEMENEESVWKAFDKKLRNAIRKAEKLKLTTDSGLKYLDDFYRIYQENMRDLGSPVDDKKFFEELVRNFEDNIDIIVTKKDEEVISALFLIKYGDTVKSEWASSYRKYFGMNSAQLTYWEAIKKYCNDYDYFDFGRSVEDEGTWKFKRKFNAKPKQLFYKFFLNNCDMPNTLKTSTKRKVFSFIWKKLPLFVTNHIGPILRRRFA
jgi:FemAB-related protein (PEP-CTERM system-associated)